jgi:hypothetical protein
MEDSEEQALNRADDMPMWWFWYVDDMFIVWPHGPEKLDDFLNYLNSIPLNIQFTMDTELDHHLPFLDFDTYRRVDGSLGHTVYRKPTLTDLYLNAKSHHHPANKHSMLATPEQRARTICNQESFPGEMHLLHSTFKLNSYNDRSIGPSIHLRARTNLERI